MRQTIDRQKAAEKKLLLRIQDFRRVFVAALGGRAVRMPNELSNSPTTQVHSKAARRMFSASRICAYSQPPGFTSA
jgi:hypothetical protein